MLAGALEVPITYSILVIIDENGIHPVICDAYIDIIIWFDVGLEWLNYSSILVNVDTVFLLRFRYWTCTMATFLQVYAGVIIFAGRVQYICDLLDHSSKSQVWKYLSSLLVSRRLVRWDEYICTVPFRLYTVIPICGKLKSLTLFRYYLLPISTFTLLP